MSTTPSSPADLTPKRPSFYLSVAQVRESGLLTPERWAELEAEMERRLSLPRDSEGRSITSHILADLSPYGRYLYPHMDHEPNWGYPKKEILSVILTDQERAFLEKHALGAQSARRDAQRLEKADKILWSLWDGWVTDDDRYWESVGEYLDEVSEGDDPLTDDNAQVAYLWAARPQVVIHDLDASDVVEHLVCDRGWEDMGIDDLNGVKELQSALDAFVKANETVVSYTPDYTKAIILPRLPTNTLPTPS